MPREMSKSPSITNRTDHPIKYTFPGSSTAKTDLKAWGLYQLLTDDVHQRRPTRREAISKA
ncbi:hypothetical protein E4U57_007504 [Claviceps arundinis]|uniref:Uncharacterized protein n=1 Tax=Claviceps arundinis TaxID=1623583 RepID=A0ABQ7PEY3_9HYPO|nr:hypothetical protein E4U57_007504 [Claviceps arundinis]